MLLDPHSWANYSIALLDKRTSMLLNLPRIRGIAKILEVTATFQSRRKSVETYFAFQSLNINPLKGKN